MCSAEENVFKDDGILRSFNIQALDITDHFNILKVITYSCMYCFLLVLSFNLNFLEFFRA